MAQPTQVIFGTPNNDMCVIDNSAASLTSTLAGNGVNASPIGFDTPANNSIVPAGSVAQGLNSFGDTGTVLVDPVNDQVPQVYKAATFSGNPVSGVSPTAKTVKKVLTNPLSATVLWKNPS